MFGKQTIKLDKDLFERVRKIAKISGYATVDEFVVHVLEKELAAVEDADSDEEIKKKLEGLGYIS
jgi:H2-forming N5,N10-methylenetetrahydromethanopterin dehydrogenase-like enzyme